MERLPRKAQPPARLVLADKGPHQFGGAAIHRGATPSKSRVPLHLLLTLDLADKQCPFGKTDTIRFLPLYYPLKYGIGGGKLQYAVKSDKTIEILDLSPPKADPVDQQYVRVDALPRSAARLTPLEYEEARILAFMDARSGFRSNRADRKILERLDVNHLVLVGNDLPRAAWTFDIKCRNKRCQQYNRKTALNCIADVATLPVNGSDEFWYQYRGGPNFVFASCAYCHTIITFNYCT